MKVAPANFAPQGYSVGKGEGALFIRESSGKILAKGQDDLVGPPFQSKQAEKRHNSVQKLGVILDSILTVFSLLFRLKRGREDAVDSGQRRKSNSLSQAKIIFAPRHNNRPPNLNP